MDYSSQHGLSSFIGRKMMITIYLLLLWGSSSTQSTTTLTETEKIPGNHSTTEPSKPKFLKRGEPEAQRREHSFNADGTVNYHGSGSGHDSGDLVPPPGGNVFNTPSIELSIGQTAASGPGLSNSYGLPIPDDSYGPPKNFFNDKPALSFYRSPSQQYGPPNNRYLSPPKPVYGPPKPSFRPQSPPKPGYSTSSLSQFQPLKTTYVPVKPVRSKPSFSSRPKPVYGPPKEGFGNSFSSGTLLSPITNIKSQYGPPKISATYGTPLQPSTSYGLPKHGHTKAPPTPPIVKYDGWKPIPGLVSNAPSGSYGTPDTTGHGISTAQGVDFLSSTQISGGGFDSIAPPSGSYGAPSFGGTSFEVSGLGIQLQPSNLYGPPPKPSTLYGTPLQPSSSYGPPSHKGSSKLNLFSSFKPSSSSYGLPEPSLAPVPPKPSHSYGPPKSSGISYTYRVPQLSSLKAPSGSYGPPKPPSSSYGPPKSPSSSYGPPSIFLGSFTSTSGASSSFSSPQPPSSSYGSPKPPGSSYGLPKPPSNSYGPPKPPSNSYGPPKPPSNSYGPPKPPSNSYGPPKPPSSFYGPPKPPSNSYSSPKPPSNSYGPPKPPSSSYSLPQVFTSYSIPKPGLSSSVSEPNTAYRGTSVPHPLQPPSIYGPPSFQEGLYKTPLPPNALYGVPTGPATATDVGCCGPPESSWQFQSNTYGVPLSNLHAPAVSSVEINSQFLSTGTSSGLPSTSYGPPLTASTPASAHPPASTYGVPTALPLRQPKNPVKFRPPVPAGLISSIGAKWGDSAAWGGSSHSHKFHGNTYIPPAVPDPDPGIHANKGNPLVIPPPSAPPITYGSPASSQEIQVSNQFTSTASSYSSEESNLFPPPPPPPPPTHDQSSFEIQQSASVELPSSKSVNHQIHDNKNQLSAVGITSYNTPADVGIHQVAVNPNYNSGVQNIPIQGTQGSYTLQIQAAGGNSGAHIPHNEVLSNGLLQDILAAIENPNNSDKLEQYGGQQSSDPVANEIGLNILKQLEGTHAQQSNSIQLPTQYGSDLSHASSSNVPLYSQNSDMSNEVVQMPLNITESDSDFKIGKYLSQNKVALYYNNQEGLEERKEDEKDIFLVQMLLPNNSTISESEKSEFGTIVSIKLQNAQNVESKNSTQTQGGDGS